MLTVLAKNGYLHVTAEGRRSLETALAISRDLMDACGEHSTPVVLLDARKLEGRLPTIETYRLLTLHLPKIRNTRILNKAAIVELEENEESNSFFETVADNRGYNLRVFTSIEDASRWLGCGEGGGNSA
ncbi:hypothetical protein ACFLQU_00030 [Verrucomicrobiota bacterium]